MREKLLFFFVFFFKGNLLHQLYLIKSFENNFSKAEYFPESVSAIIADQSAIKLKSV